MTPRFDVTTEQLNEMLATDTAQAVFEQNLLVLDDAALGRIVKKHNWRIDGNEGLSTQIATRLSESIEKGVFLVKLSPAHRNLMSALHLLYDLNRGVSAENITSTYTKFLRKKGGVDAALTALIDYGLLFDTGAKSGKKYRALWPFQTAQLNQSVTEYAVQQTPALSTMTTVAPARPIAEVLLQIGRIVTRHKTLETSAMISAEWETKAAKGDQLPIDLATPLLSYDSAVLLARVDGNHGKIETLFEILLGLKILVPNPENANSFHLNETNWSAAQLMPADQLSQTAWAYWHEVLADQSGIRKLLRDKTDWAVWRRASRTFDRAAFMDNQAAGCRTIVRFLAQLAAQRNLKTGDWITFDDFTKKIARWRPDLYHDTVSDTTWGFLRKGTVIPLKSPRFWSESYGAIIEDTIAGPLHWFGLVEVRAQAGEPIAFRLTPAGRSRLHPSSKKIEAREVVASDTTICEWQHDLALRMKPGNDYAELALITNRYMRPVPRKRQWYELHEGKLEKAFAGGESTAQIVQALAPLLKESSAEIIILLTERLNDMHARYGVVHLYEAVTIIEFGDDFALSELRAMQLLDDDIIIHEFSPQLIAIHDSAVDRIVKALQKKGYMPGVVQSEAGA